MSEPFYRSAEVYMFDTCTLKCGYCWLAESGQVLDSLQLTRFRDLAFIHKITAFFNSRTTENELWLLQLTGGEPLLAPNLRVLCEGLFSSGNRVSFYTGLFVDEKHPGFSFLMEHSQPDVDYIMASFHPESEVDEEGYFRKLKRLKEAGHNVFLRFVGHPGRLHRLAELARKCEQLDICFYPTTLLSNRYPGAYSEEERSTLSRYFSSLSQFIQLEGGVDTRTVQCFAGSKVIAVNLQTGNITPCISVATPLLGNLFEERLNLSSSQIACPQAGINCVCDCHYQQNIVIGTEDNEVFENLKKGFSAPRGFQAEIEAMRAKGIRFYGDPKARIGDVTDESRLFYSISEVKDAFRRRWQGVDR